MSLIFNQADWDELHQQALKPQMDNVVLDDFEELWGMPKSLGQGYSRGDRIIP